MLRPVIVAMAAAAIVLSGPGCARDLARATSGVIGCAPEDIAIDDVSLGWSETSWAASCGGARFRCAGERAPWCAPEVAGAGPAPERAAEPTAPTRPDAAAGREPRAAEPGPADPAPSDSEPSDAAATPEAGANELPPGHPIPTLESMTDAPH